MATDRSLTTLLRALQRPLGEEDASRLLGSATTLLTLLSNPLNLTLLSSQLLSAPAIWRNVDGLTLPYRILNVINTASIQLVRNERDANDRSKKAGFNPQHLPARDGLDRVEWARAVARGADDRSPKWKHLLILGGLLVGFEAQRRRGLPLDLRRTLETSIVDAANAALEDPNNILPHDEAAAGSIVLVLGHVLPLLSVYERARLRHDLLLAIATQQILFSPDGLRSGYFLGVADRDVLQLGRGAHFSWSGASASFYQMQKTAGSPLVSALGLMAALMAEGMSRVSDPRLALKTVDRLAEFTRSLAVQWRLNKLSEVDATEEAEYLDQETRTATLPELWRLLRAVLFAVVVVQRALMARVLGGGDVVGGNGAGSLPAAIPRDSHAYVAVQTLHMLRNLSFVATRMGAATGTQYIFVYMTAIDILAAYPSQAEAFLSEIRPKPANTPALPQSAANTATNSPAPINTISAHPLDRSLDLFFFNTSEHFPLILTPAASSSLLLSSAEPYLQPHAGDPRLLALFEAAHSVVLAVFSAPQNYALAAAQVPGYVSTLQSCFPGNLSARQFRLACRTLVRLASPPNRLAQTSPFMASAILELLRERFQHASEDLLPSTPQQSQQPGGATSGALSAADHDDQASSQPGGVYDQRVSEKAALLLTVIDSLPALSLEALDEWLPLTAQMLLQVRDGAMQEACRRRFWDVLSAGEMDVPRAELCVGWWNSRGGRSLVLGLGGVGVGGVGGGGGSGGSGGGGAGGGGVPGPNSALGTDSTTGSNAAAADAAAVAAQATAHSSGGNQPSVGRYMMSGALSSREQSRL